MNENLQKYWSDLRTGKKEALLSLYHELYFHLVRLGLTICADEDITKDCINQLFLRLWDKRATLSEVKDVRSYMFSALRNHILDELNYQSKAEKFVSKTLKKEPETESSYEDLVINVEKDEELRNKIKKALQMLSPRQLELIQLRFFEGLSYREIAEKSNHTIKTSYNIIYDAIKILKNHLK